MSKSDNYKIIDILTSLSKRRGFIFQSSEIYGGLASTWDYGPLGVELKRNIKNLVSCQARLATKAKLDGLVCSAQEVKIVNLHFINIIY